MSWFQTLSDTRGEKMSSLLQSGDAGWNRQKASSDWAECQCSGAGKCFLSVPNCVLAPSVSSHSAHGAWTQSLAFAQGIAPSGGKKKFLSHAFPIYKLFTSSFSTSVDFFRCGELAAVLEEVFRSFTQSSSAKIQKYSTENFLFIMKIYLNVQVVTQNRFLSLYTVCYTILLLLI